MVSFWPWKGDDTASFEKTLSSLSERIKKANLKQDRLRTSSRRYKVLWTLYSSLAYLVIALVLVLVTGWESWGPVEYTAVAGGPLLIYALRALLTTLYAYLLNSNQTYLDNLTTQRDDAIEKFKNATKYNSTQQLLEKYGAAPKQPPTPPSTAGKRKAGDGSRKSTPQPQRTGMPPPPTANIRRPSDMGGSQSGSPVQNGPSPYYNTPPQQHNPSRPSSSSLHSPTPSASFAPNAFTSPLTSTSTPQYADPSHRQWYDRIFDVLLGEDETRASNRLALVCVHCKLVNGQAPPGVKRVEDVGRWRCAECRGWNGVEGVESVLAKESAGERKQEVVQEESARPGSRVEGGVEGEPGPAVDADAEEADVTGTGDEAEGDKDEIEPPARSTRSRKKKSSDSD